MARGLDTGVVVHAMACSAASAVLESQGAALRDEPDGVHQHRTRVRRLRSVLAGLHRAVAIPGAQPVRVAFAAWGAQLGVVRDIEVSADVAIAQLDAAHIDDAQVRRRLVDADRSSYALAFARLVVLAAEPAAQERMRMLRAFADSPCAGIVVRTNAAAVDALTDVLAHEAARVRRAHDRVDGSRDAYHALRKSGRRLRYVAEAVDDALGMPLGRALAEAGEGVHDALGDHRDALLFAERVAIARARARRVGEPEVLYDRLIDQAHGTATDRLDELPAVMDDLDAAATALKKR